MRTIAFFSATASLLGAAPAVAQTIDTTATPITLNNAITLAQRNALTTVQARGSIRTSEAAVKQSYAAFLPSMSVSASTQSQRGDRFDTQGNRVPFTGNPTNYSTGFQSSLQLLTGDAGSSTSSDPRQMSMPPRPGRTRHDIRSRFR